jgi:hypothetical protein
MGTMLYSNFGWLVAESRRTLYSAPVVMEPSSYTRKFIFYTITVGERKKHTKDNNFIECGHVECFLERMGR